MFTRVVTFTDAKDIDAGVTFTRETVIPVLHQQKGFRGLTASVDWAHNVLGVLTVWETAADRDASESALLKVREEAQKHVGGPVSVELFEEALMELVGGTPAVGSSLLITRALMDPAQVDAIIAQFKREVLPEIKQGHGLLALRMMVNRQSGQSLVGTVWTDVASLRAAAQTAQERQQLGELPVRITGRSEREIVLIDLP